MRALPTQPLRRLSSEQYQNTLRDLFGSELAAPLVANSLFPPTVISNGFANDAEANIVNTSQSNSIEDNGERIAGVILSSPDKYLRALLPCTLGSTIADAQIDGCIDAFVSKFGLRAYRRPLVAREAALARRVYDQTRSTQGAVAAWSAVVQFFVQSPALLYRVERGAGPAPGVPGLLKLTDYEMASRLSYLFLNSMPDDELLAAAAGQRLSTSQQVAAQARRLLQSPRFYETLAGFHRDWLHLHELQAGKDTAIFPEYTAAVASSLQREPLELLRHVLEKGDGTLKTLLDTPTSVVNATLAAYLRVSAPNATGSAWAPIAIPNRRGLLTQASFMAALAQPDRTSPIHRGAFFRQSIMCDVLPTLPADVDTATPLKGTSNLPTARERLAPLLTRGDCAGCHTQINPTGLALENYDAVGRWRDKENGANIDASGSIDAGQGQRSFMKPTELIEILAGSDKVRDCYATNWFRAALGRQEFPEDACSIATLQAEVKRRGGDLRELIVALTATDAFLYRRPPEE